MKTYVAHPGHDHSQDASNMIAYYVIGGVVILGLILGVLYVLKKSRTKFPNNND